MPWLVLGFGLLIVPLGAVSIFFIIIQPILFDTWCGLCLITAVITVLMIPYAADELFATTQFLSRSWRAGRPFWRTFWRGGQLPGGTRDDNPGIDSPIGVVLKTFTTGGVTYPWTLVAVTALGIVLMCTRLLFDASGAMADSDHLLGCLIIAVSVTAFAEVARPLRFLSVPMGAWLIAAPFVLQGATTLGTIASVRIGAAVIALSLPRGKLSGEHYGGWDRYIV
ncbi:MAG: SPW repeat domain-containing protein, partial [Burkholderiaceae bacterium]